MNANCKWNRSGKFKEGFKKKCYPIIKRQGIKGHAKPNPFYTKLIRTFKRNRRVAPKQNSKSKVANDRPNLALDKIAQARKK